VPVAVSDPVLEEVIELLAKLVLETWAPWARTVQTLTHVIEARVREWRGLLRGAPQRARQILRKLLPGRLRLDRTPEGYWFYGQIAITSLFAGIASPLSVVPPA
jgi:hypothetical protein